MAKAPKLTGGPQNWQHRQLYDNVVKTLYALPEEFKTSLAISDFRATDIFTLNSALGASIEDAVVSGLNKLRDVWDPNGLYAVYRFERQSQAFPDVRLVTKAPGQTPILLGIELKGWFALSKEGEPTFRYAITPDACAPADLLVIYPWILSDVIAGSPKLLPPFVGEAKYAAQLRNYYWQHLRSAQGNSAIVTASHRTPYPAVKSDQCSDRAAEDAGGNFGRIARYGLLDTFVPETTKLEASGIPIAAWLAFLRLFTDKERELAAVIDTIESSFRKYTDVAGPDRDALRDSFERIVAILKAHAAPPNAQKKSKP